MGSQDWTSEDIGELTSAGIDTERPSAARVYDYFLGGAHNFEADRRMAEQVLSVFPETPLIARANRAFLRRAVEYLVHAGVRQFLDIGSGVPTVGHVHEIAQGIAPESRVVFVDVDPVAVAHSRLMLAGNDRTSVIAEDVRSPERILAAPELTALLDLSQPVAVLLVALFHFVPDADDPVGILSRLTAWLASGSYLVVSHFTEDGQDRGEGMEIYRRSGIEVVSRSRAQVEALFAGFDLVEPGVVWTPLWRPESPDDVFYDRPEASTGYAVVGRKP
jgi:hypothetical protein